MATCLTFAIPVNWDSTQTYEVNMIVFVGKKAYTAIQNVPSGIDILNTAYWAETGVPYVDVTAIRQKLTEIETDVDDNTADIAQAQADIVTNANNLTQLTTRLNAAVTAIENDATRLDNVIYTLYTPYTVPANNGNGGE